MLNAFVYKYVERKIISPLFKTQEKGFHIIDEKGLDRCTFTESSTQWFDYNINNKNQANKITLLVTCLIWETWHKTTMGEDKELTIYIFLNNLT